MCTSDLSFTELKTTAKCVTMVLKFVNSTKGNPMLFYNGFIHNKEKTIGEKIIWKCSKYIKNRCPGRVHTLNEEVVKSTPHMHVADIAEVEARKTVIKMKEMATRAVEASTQNIVATIFSQVPTAISSKLPAVVSAKRTIQRVRRKGENCPAIPTSLEDLVLPREFAYINEEQFLLFDSGPGEKRILLFSTRNNLEFMKGCSHWYADGTFSSAPLLFSQLYTIHGVKYSNVIPTIYALLPNKTQETYLRLLQALKDLKPDLAPSSIMVDFERAAINSFEQEFPTARIRGCFFHLTQSLWRHAQENGLQRRYSEDAEFALQLKLLAALAFVPPNNVANAFETLLDSDFYVENENLLMPLINYFEDTYIGRIDRRKQRRSSRFPIEMWNVYDFQDLPRTNNSVEGWHNSFSSILNAAHPCIWKFIKALKKEEGLNRIKIEHFIAGFPQPQKKVYKDSAQRMNTVINDYANRPLLEYLRGIAYNFQLQV